MSELLNGEQARREEGRTLMNCQASVPGARTWSPPVMLLLRRVYVRRDRSGYVSRVQRQCYGGGCDEDRR